MEEKVENEKVKVNVKLTIILVIVSIILVVGGICLGFFLGSNSSDDKTSGKELEEKEENKDQNVVSTTPIDIEEAPNKTVVEVEKYKLEISTTRPDYYEMDEELMNYKDGYVGYYSDEVISYNNIGSGITFIDAPKHKFVQLYKCKNPEYGKCGYAEPLGVNGTYNLEEGLKNSDVGLVYLDNRYIFVYDSEYYLVSPYASYFSKEVPLIVYDTKEDKELGKYAAIVYGYGDNSNSLIAVDLDGNYGVISIKDGQITNIIDFKYDYIGRLYSQNGIMLVDDGQYYVYYPHTNTMVGPFNNQIASYSDKYIVTNEGSYSEETEKNYRLYDITGKKILVDSGYKYMEIVDQSSKEYIIVINKDGALNIINQEGEEILDKWITDIYGFYHIRCCDAIMAYRYKLNGSSYMQLYITKAGKNIEDGEVEFYLYTIDLFDKTYQVSVADDYY